MTTWKEVEQTVQEAFDRDDPHARSTQKHLLKILNVAEEWNIDPTYAEQASLSNLREIIREARSAIHMDNRERLEELFQWAAKYTNKDLRIKIRDLDRETIIVKVIPDKHASKYVIEVTEDQLQRIKRATKLQYTYRIEKE
jgi:hypothetical protein